MTYLEEIQVLVVDDSSTTRSMVEQHLGEAYITIHATNGEEAWQLIKNNSDISLVFADLHMPVMNGMILLKQIRDAECERISSLPVIMLTAHEDTDAAKQASYNLGATDFISKPFSALDIQSRVRSYADLNKRITSLEQGNTHNHLTGLLNRNGFMEMAEKAMSSSRRYHFDMSILKLEIFELENIVNNHGNHIGEQVIKNVAGKIKNNLRTEDFPAYLGHGQFYVMLPMTKVFKAHIVAMRLKTAIAKLTFQLNNDSLRAELAIGLVSAHNNHAQFSLDEVCKQVDEALKLSVNDRAGKIVRYDELLNDEVQDDVEDVMEVVFPNEPAVVTRQYNQRNELRQMDAHMLGEYMSAILSGDYSVIAGRHMQALIEPLNAFISYANDNRSVDDDEQSYPLN